jgi:hypothetical protein
MIEEAMLDVAERGDLSDNVVILHRLKGEDQDFNANAAKSFQNKGMATGSTIMTPARKDCARTRSKCLECGATG